MLYSLLVTALLGAAPSACQGPDAPIPTIENSSAWRAHILPSAAEVQHEEIPWLTEFGEGVLQGDSQGKPILLWAMNGHPLGCT